MNVIDNVAITGAMITGGDISEPASGETAYNSGTAYNIGDRAIRTSTHKVYESLRGKSFTVVFTNVSPYFVISKVAHGLADGDAISFTTTGTLPDELDPGDIYYVVNKTDDTFQIEYTVGGGAQGNLPADFGSGTHTCVVSSNVGKTPEDNLDTYWREVGPTQKLALYDGDLQTYVTATTSFYQEITLTEKISALCFHEMSGVTSIKIEQYVGATKVYDTTYAVTGKRSKDVWDLYNTAATKLKFTVTGGSMTVGALDVGTGYYFGNLQQDASLPKNDLTLKKYDEYGKVVPVRRPLMRGMSGVVFYALDLVEEMEEIYNRVRSKVCTWVGVRDHDDLSVAFTMLGNIKTHTPNVKAQGAFTAIVIDGAPEA